MFEQQGPHCLGPGEFFKLENQTVLSGSTKQELCPQTELMGLMNWKKVIESKEELDNQVSGRREAQRALLGIKEQDPVEVFPRR